MASGIKNSLCKKEKIETKTIKEWAKTKYDFDKVPTIFLLYK